MNTILKIAFSLSALLIGQVSFAQKDEYVPPTPRNDDYNYTDNVRSVRLYPADSETDYPILQLGSPIQMVLEFDDLEAYNKNYFYKIIHCDAQWNPSTDITVIDYIEGFQENRIYSGENSFNTRTVEYVHYELRFPNSDIKLKKSGNYLLKVYLNNDENELVLTRRFMVFEPKMKVVPEMRRSATPPNAQTHQELRFTLQYAGISVPNPIQDIKIAVLQNGRWDKCIQNFDPTAIRRDEQAYDLQGKIIFPAMREFRPLDLRTLRARSNQINNIGFDAENQVFMVELFEHFSRQDAVYSFVPDLNGKFILQSFDFPNVKLQGEYARVKFSLNMSEMADKDVYVMGSFSDWQLYERHKMSFNPDKEVYEGEFLMKTGYYDFHYVYVPKGQPDMPHDFTRTEGSSFETENDYLFLIYYKPYGGRYDQLVAVQKYNSRPK